MYPHGRVVKKPVYFFFLCRFILFFSFATDTVASSSVTAECQIEADYLQQVTRQDGLPGRTESFSCFKSIDELVSSDALIVDVRPPEAFRQARIPGSVNLSISRLLRTDPLRDQDLLVVDQGFSRSRMAELCSKAQASGFERLSILIGGTAAWAASGQEMQGSPAAIHNLTEIEPRAFFSEVSKQRVSVVLEQGQSEGLENLLGNQVRVSELNLSGGPTEQQLISLLSSHDEIFPIVYVGSDPAVKAFARTNRSLFVLDQSMIELQRSRHRLVASATKRSGIPERYKCGG